MAKPADIHDPIEAAKIRRNWLQAGSMRSSEIVAEPALSKTISLAQSSNTSGVEIGGVAITPHIEKYELPNAPVQMSEIDLSTRNLQQTRCNDLNFLGEDARILRHDFSPSEAATFGRCFLLTERKQYIEGDSEHFDGLLRDENGSLKEADELDLLIPILLPPVRLNTVHAKNLFQPLWRYQLEGVSFLIERKEALLADEMGLGKTVQAILALRVLIHNAKVRKALIVAPKSVIGSARQSLQDKTAEGWSGHLALWASELIVKVIEPAAWIGGTPPPGFSGNSSLDRQSEWNIPAHVYLTTYDLIRNDIKKGTLDIEQFDCVILDEVHNIKNPNSQQSQALHQLNAEYRWGLTGTPVMNRAGDLYAIFQFLLPTRFPPLRQKELSEISLSQIFDEVSDYYLRRNKLEDLPPKKRHEIWIELDCDQKLAYESILEDGQTRIRQLINGVPEIQVRKSIFGLIQKLKGVCNFSPHKSHSPKLTALVNLVESELEKGRKILIFSQYLGNGIEKIFPNIKKYGCVQLVGNMTTFERNKVVSDFRRNDDIKLFLGSLRATGVGLNLTSASIVVHFDHWWNPAVMWQAEDRAHRQGQTKTVDVYSFWVKNTIEERIYKILEKKEKLIREIMAKDTSDVHSKLENVIEFDEWLKILDI